MTPVDPPRRGSRTLWESIRDLPVEVSRFTAVARDGTMRLADGRPRRCSLVAAAHEELVGLGEDVSFGAGVHPTLGGDLGRLDGLLGRRAFGELAEALDGVDLGPPGAFGDLLPRFRRWAVESASLDLCLRQNGGTLPSLLGLEPMPLEFVSSRRLDWSGWAAELDALRGRTPAVALKVNFDSCWNGEVVRQLASGLRVSVVDFKVPFDRPRVSRDDLRLVLDGLPGAIVEDPGLDPSTLDLVQAARDRLAFDLPLRDVADLDRLELRPAAVNLKPARIGSLRGLSAWYARAADEGLGVYGGGWAEQFVGRGQAQLLASLLHPSGPNDLAPAAYNAPCPPGSDLPASPLRITCSAGSGFGVDADQIVHIRGVM